MVHHPLATNYCIVDCDGNKNYFAEVSGLDMERELIEYREGGSATDHSVKMPGLRRYGNIVLKRGLVKMDGAFYKWMQAITQHGAERKDLVISLLNERHQPVLQWKVHRAWPCKITAPHLKAQANEVVVETIELAHEGLELME